MKLDLTQVINDLYGDPIPAADAQGKLTGGDVTVRRVLRIALTTKAQSEKNEYKDQLERFILALKMVENDEVELEADQIVNLKKWVATRYAQLVTGRICMLLEGKAADAAPGKDETPPERKKK